MVDFWKGTKLLCQVGIAVQLCSMSQTPCPCIDTGNGVGGSLLTLLVLSVMSEIQKLGQYLFAWHEIRAYWDLRLPGDSAMSSFSFYSLSIGADQNGSHQTERTVALVNEKLTFRNLTQNLKIGPKGHTPGQQCLIAHLHRSFYKPRQTHHWTWEPVMNIRRWLTISFYVIHKAAKTSHYLCNHVVDEAMFIPDACSLKVFFVSLLVNILRKFHRISLVQCFIILIV